MQTVWAAANMYQARESQRSSCTCEADDPWPPKLPLHQMTWPAGIGWGNGQAVVSGSQVPERRPGGRVAPAVWQAASERVPVYLTAAAHGAVMSDNWHRILGDVRRDLDPPAADRAIDCSDEMVSPRQPLRPRLFQALISNTRPGGCAIATSQVRTVEASCFSAHTTTVVARC